MKKIFILVLQVFQTGGSQIEDLFDCSLIIYTYFYDVCQSQMLYRLFLRQLCVLSVVSAC